MQDKKGTITTLTNFREKHKFSTRAFHERGLQSSDAATCNVLELLLNNCTDELIAVIANDGKPAACEKVLVSGLKSIRRADYDTEEREMIAGYFYDLSDIASVNIKFHLNALVYGKTFSVFISVYSFIRGKDRIVETLTQDCSGCGSRLQTFILGKKSGIPDYNWHIIQCHNCHGYELLSVGPDVKGFRFGGYHTVEQLLKKDYTEEQANIRLEQIRYFRKH